MKRGEYLGVGVVFLVWVWTGVATGDTHNVVQGQSIQGAIDAADNGDEIEVAPGTYTGSGDETEGSALLDFKGKAVRLYSRDGPGGTTIDGSAIYNRNSSPGVTNCTIVDNDIGAAGPGSGGAVYNEDSHPTVTNCILWGNSGGQITGDPGTVTYSDVQGGWTGAGNINADPRFAGAGDYHLAADSPCIDAGMNSPPGGLPATDIEGNPRALDGNGDGSAVVDMGAYEASAVDAGQLLRNLMQRVRDLNLPAGLTTSLEAKLNTALGKAADGAAKNDGAAINALEAFIHEVKAQRGKEIAEDDADALVAAAQQIIDLGGDS